MSICDEIQNLIANYEGDILDTKECERYEKASTSFQILVEKGFAYKRGYQLLPIESKVCDDVNFNIAKQ